MARKGYKFTPEQRERMRQSHLGQKAWNAGTGGCKRGHDPARYVAGPSGVYVCLDCKRENGLKYRKKNRQILRLKNRVGRYGITVEAYHALMEAQNNGCAICEGAITFENCRIDHDHSTGEVRGILCVSCNTGIGLMQDSPDVLTRAAAYLSHHHERRDRRQSTKAASEASGFCGE